MLNISAVVNSLGPSQKSFYLIKEFNKSRENTDISTSVFYERPAIPVTPTLFSCRNISFFSDYEGIAFATKLEDANCLLKTCNNAVKCLYLWDIDWLTSSINYRPACDILHDQRLNLIARSESHATIIQNFCNRKCAAIIDNWNLEQIIDFYDGYMKKEQEKEEKRRERMRRRLEQINKAKKQNV